MRELILALIFVTPMLGYSINNESNDLDAVDPKMTGYKDEAGKQAYWIIYGADMPEKADYPATGKIEEGEYKNDRKVGEWIFYHTDGATPRLKGNFLDGRANGAYTKFDLQGNKQEQGSYNNGKQSGDFKTFHKNGTVAIQKTFTIDGKETGTTTHFYENGQPQLVVTKVNGVSTGESTRYWEDGSVKEVVTYSAEGKVISTKEVNPNPPTTATVETGSGGPSGANLKTKDGKKFAADGYNKLYNKSDEIEMDGTFKGGKLWEGKLYKYDTDGILLKIEIWKNGKYHSDGQL